MFLETFATMNVLYDAEKKTTYAKTDKSLDEVADGLRGVMEEIDRMQAAKERPEPSFSEQREHIQTGALQDELFRRRRDEMIDQAAFHARYMDAMNKLYDIASRKE
jgi:hypothetical protein